MRDPEFRRLQEQGLHEPHIAPITEFIESLRTPERWLPYVAPLHGGIHARVMTVLRDPGPATRQGVGSGMLCTENDDQTAATQCHLMESAGLSPEDLTPWNAYPWYINRAPRTSEIREGAHVLARMLDLMPDVRVVLLTGRDAQKSWDVAVDNSPSLQLRVQSLSVLRTFHASAQALQTKNPDERTARIRHRLATWAEAGRIALS